MLYTLLSLIVLLLALILAQLMGAQDEESNLEDPFPRMRMWFVFILIGALVVATILYYIFQYLGLAHIA